MRRLLVLWLALAVLACERPVPVPTPGTSTGSSATATAAPPPAKERRRPAGADEPPRVALGTKGAVATAESNATDVGLAVLAAGGNAVDAAVAVAFALAVTHPSAGNIGGGGFMVVRTADGRTGAIDYRETAPARATRDMYLDAKGEPTKDSLVGAKAAGIPGTVAGLALAHQRFGTRPWKELVMPAVKLAREGHQLDDRHAASMANAVSAMKEAGLTSSMPYFSRPDGSPFVAGDVWRQPELAATLEAIAEHGAAAFYRGPLAERMASEVARAGGIWQASDLESYQAVARDPLAFAYRGWEVITMPPPSAGGVVLRQVLGAAELFDLASKPWHGVDETHVYLEATRRAYADRNTLLADPRFVNVPLAQLLDSAYVRSRMSGISLEHATPSSEVVAGLPAPAARGSEQTTHFSIIDGAGDAVSNTYTLNTGFGCKLVVPGVGVLLNNEMDDFAAKPGSANVYGLVQAEANAIAPGKRMLSSMTPTILVKDGEVRAVVGTPGGPTISTTVVQIVRALVDYGRPLDEAVAAPRLHHQWLPDLVFAEESVPAELVAALEARGHKVKRRPPIGHANCVEVDPASRGFRAVADTARDGGKAGAI